MRVSSLLHQLRQGSSLSQESLMCVTWLTSWEMACVLEMMVTAQHCLPCRHSPGALVAAHVGGDQHLEGDAQHYHRKLEVFPL